MEFTIEENGFGTLDIMYNGTAVGSVETFDFAEEFILDYEAGMDQ